jgi:hypothetical protein
MNSLKNLIMKTLFFLIFISGISNLYSQCANEENIYTFSYNNNTYEIVKELQSWSNAASCAVERGGCLVEINNADEQSAIFDAIINGAQISPSYISISNGGGIAYVWIGATDTNIEGTWLWDGNNDQSGTHFWTGQGANGQNNGLVINGAYINWGGSSIGNPNEPDNYSNQDAAAIGLTGWPAGTNDLGIAGEWNDITSTAQIYYIIEYTTTGIDNSNLNTKPFKIFPNPTYESIQIEGNNIQNIIITDNTGRIVIKSSLTNINLSDMKSGLYLISADSDNGKIYDKIIKL